MRLGTEATIIVVDDRAEEASLVAALDAGADDYLNRPYGIEELLARLRATLRRAIRPSPEAPIATADFTVHLGDRRWLDHDRTEIRLTPTEWRLVEMLISRPRRLVTQTELLQAIWGPQATDRTEYLRVHMTTIRRKVEPDPAHPRYFVTAPGLGLRFDPDGGVVPTRS